MESGFCRNVITQNSFDYKPLYSHDFSKGILYHASSEPYLEDDNLYHTLDLEFRIYCDPTQTSSDIPISVEVDDASEAGLFIVTMNSSAGCPIPTASPSPTPMYQPHCKYIKRLSTNPKVGLDIDLSTLNGGPFGIKIPITIKNEEHELFFQPCERVQCPSTYICVEGTDIYSSSWLCNSSRICTSYGVSVDNMDFDQIGAQPTNGMILRLNNTFNNKKSEIYMRCKHNFPNDHFFWSPQGELNDEVFSILGQSEELCVTPIPSPDPYSCHFSTEQKNYSLNINLTKYNKDPNGYEQIVEVYDHIGNHYQRKLLYNPCGHISCPKNAFCDGDEDAQIWLCHDISSQSNCIGYGLAINNVTMELYEESDLFSGILALYKGDIKRTADITYVCNENLKENEIIIPKVLNLTGHKLMFEVESKDACPINIGPTPKPSYTWHPKIPTKGYTATPTPLVSPNPFDIIYNDTHYININLDELKQSVYEGNELIISDSNYGNVYIKYHPWILTNCPNNYLCGGNVNTSNLWICWVENNGTKYCHPSADKRIKFSMNFFEQNDIDGAILTYEGAYGIQTKFNVLCSNLEDNLSIPFDQASIIEYNELSNTQNFVIKMDSGYICPKSFYKPSLPPSPLITPIPQHNNSIKYDVTYKLNENKIIELNLKKFTKTKESYVIFGDKKKYMKSFVTYSPYTKTKCPNNYKCINDVNANLWLCINSTIINNICIPIGDSEQKLDFKLLDKNGIVKVNIGGEYPPYDTELYFVCDENGNKNDFEFQKIGDFMNDKIGIYVNTKNVCPRSYSKTSVGAIIGFIILLCLICYLGVGVIFIYIRTGEVKLPNNEFWVKLDDKISEIWKFVVSCGRDNTKYEKI
ncbi:hypothetical protein GPJ56_005601 [Histomonas meleagridis]|uniref:uncharacterized protein n=1 Tax=Histomonas meleagridis TaxID=135588 RepID=UPI003559A0BB|nr:hypothetical protein GPJ56_005601 [Histomonas meleagridis]KAH0797589.1 hypothetical protein GO595_009599 [Histomonas meleagridis]